MKGFFIVAIAFSTLAVYFGKLSSLPIDPGHGVVYQNAWLTGRAIGTTAQVIQEVRDNPKQQFISHLGYVTNVVLHTCHEAPRIGTTTSRLIIKTTRKLSNIVKEILAGLGDGYNGEHKRVVQDATGSNASLALKMQAICLGVEFLPSCAPYSTVDLKTACKNAGSLPVCKPYVKETTDLLQEHMVNDSPNLLANLQRKLDYLKRVRLGNRYTNAKIKTMLWAMDLEMQVHMMRQVLGELEDVKDTIGGVELSSGKPTSRSSLGSKVLAMYIGRWVVHNGLAVSLGLLAVNIGRWIMDPGRRAVYLGQRADQG